MLDKELGSTRMSLSKLLYIQDHTRLSPLLYFSKLWGFLRFYLRICFFFSTFALGLEKDSISYENTLFLYYNHSNLLLCGSGGAAEDGAGG